MAAWSRYRTGMPAVVAVMIACFFAGCQGTSPPPTAPTVTQIMQRAGQSGLRDTTFQLASTINFGGEQGRTIAQFAGHGTLTTQPHRTSFTYTVMGLGPVTAGTVLTDDTHVYSRDAHATQWDVHDIASASYVNRGDFFRSMLLHQITLVGAEAHAHRTTWHLRATPPTTAVAPIGDDGLTTLREDLWIEQGTYFPVEIAIAGSGRASVPNGQGQQIVTTQTLVTHIVCIQWNTGLTITLPTTTLSRT